MSDFKIEKPGKYVRRDGVIVTITSITDDPCWPARGTHDEWKINGMHCGDGNCRCDLIAPWTEPRFRAWRAEEVPDNCWVRMLGWAPGVRVQITEVDSVEVYLGHECGKITLEALFVHYIQTNGKPCGVEEAQ